jgi:hypothetical protein
MSRDGQIIEMTRAVSHRRVDFYDEVDDHRCILLASLGFSTRYICDQTGLSPSQVTYRLKKADIHFDPKIPGTYIDGADGWPRYYFDLDRAKLELEAWINKRGLAL